MLKFKIILLAISISFIIVICECIRRRKLHEKYALLWFVSAGVLLVFSVFPDALIWISESIGVFYLTTVFLISFVFLMMISFSYAISISKLADRNKNLAQEIAILKSKVERKEQGEDKDSGQGRELS